MSTNTKLLTSSKKDDWIARIYTRWGVLRVSSLISSVVTVLRLACTANASANKATVSADDDPS